MAYLPTPCPCALPVKVIGLCTQQPVLGTVFTDGFPGEDPGNRVFDGETVFSYPSFWALVPPLNESCVNAPEEEGGEVQQCAEGELDTGVSCESGGAACGRPEDFDAEQFYLPIDLLARAPRATTALATYSRPSEDLITFMEAF